MKHFRPSPVGHLSIQQNIQHIKHHCIAIAEVSNAKNSMRIHASILLPGNPKAFWRHDLTREPEDNAIPRQARQ